MAKPVAAYIGGKRRLAQRIAERIDATDHRTYAEVFVGMGSVFFARQRRPRAEKINDYGEDVANLFRILQRHYVAFMDMLRFQVTSRGDFERLTVTDPATLTDLERAARFLYLQKLTFGGKVRGRTFGVNLDGGARFDVTRLQPILEDVHERLAGVVIERLPYADFIRRYDRPATLFYLDPPYAGSEADYGRGLFGPADHERLADQLAGIRGRFILSINDTPAMRRVFGRFQVEGVRTTYLVSGGKGKPAAELIVTGPRPD